MVELFKICVIGCLCAQFFATICTSGIARAIAHPHALKMLLKERELEFCKLAVPLLGDLIVFTAD
jgi:hypothetical protein